jgi:hypothetical protein
MNKVKVIPWTGERMPDEGEIRQLLAAEGLRPYRWSNGPHNASGGAGGVVCLDAHC